MMYKQLAMAIPENQTPLFGTFGIYRFILATIVTFAHTGPTNYSACGIYAVFAFYVLSGYVVAFILKTTYLPMRYGIWKYIINRGLRIYPAYWLAVIFTLWLFALFPKEAAYLQDTAPQYYKCWFLNITSIGIVNPFTGIASPNAILVVGWSLGIELIYWALIPIFLISVQARWWLICTALIYSLGMIVKSIPDDDIAGLPLRYYNVLAASPAFCIGMFLFLKKKEVISFISPKVGAFSLLACIIVNILDVLILKNPFSIVFYLTFFINIVVIAYLMQIAQKSLPFWLCKIDIYLGNLTYPIYLLHIPIGIIIHILYPKLLLYSWLFFVHTIVVCLPIAAFMHYVLEIPVNHLKKKIKC